MMMSILPSSTALKSGASELIGRPSLMLPPSFVEEGKLEYKFYSPLKKNNNKRDKGGLGFGYNYCFSPLKQDLLRGLDKRHKDDHLVRFDNCGGEKELDLMQDKDTKWVGSSHGWLVLFNNNNKNMSLLNPVSGRSIQLPPFRKPFLDEKEKPSSLLDVILSPLPFKKKEKKLPFPLKVILSHPPDNEHCRAVAIHGSFDRAAFCSPGRCNSWSPLGLGHDHADFVYCASRQALVSFNRSSRMSSKLEFWDPSSRMQAPVMTLGPLYLSPRGWLCWTYLVSEEESGQLYMVRRYMINDTWVEYDVYAIRNLGREFVLPCYSLDDLVMFVGINHSFAVKASRFPEYKPNCIYFSGTWPNPNQEADIYDYNNKAYSQLFDDLSPEQNNWPFHSSLPWFTLTQTTSVSNLELDLLL